MTAYWAFGSVWFVGAKMFGRISFSRNEFTWSITGEEALSNSEWAKCFYPSSKIISIEIMMKLWCVWCEIGDIIIPTSAHWKELYFFSFYNWMWCKCLFEHITSSCFTVKTRKTVINRDLLSTRTRTNDSIRNMLININTTKSLVNI